MSDPRRKNKDVARMGHTRLNYLSVERGAVVRWDPDGMRLV